MSYRLAPLAEHLAVAKSRSLYLLAGRDLADPALTAHTVRIGKPVADQFAEAYQTAVKETEEAVFLPYVPGYKPDANEVQTLDLSANLEEKEVLNSIIAKLPNAAIFDAEVATISKLKLSVFEVTDGSRTAHFFRAYGPSRELSVSRWMALVQSDGRFDRISDPVLTFDPKIDFIAWDDEVHVISAYEFARLLGDQPQSRAQVQKTLRKINKKIPIDNIDEFISACQGQLQMRLKALALADADYLQDITIDDVEKVAKSFGIPLQLVRKEGKKALVFERGPATRFVILKLLEDAYVKGSLTDRRYEANSKRPI